MQALVKTKEGPGFIELQDYDMPKPGENEVLIQVKAAGICGSDIKMYRGNHKVCAPVIMGHEFSGQVVETGSSVTDYKSGDRVVSEVHNLFCGKCRFCRGGNIQLCPEKRAAGWGVNGSFAEYIKMPAFLLHRIPDNLSYEEAALVEPTGIAAQAVLVKGQTGVEDFVVIFGCGAIGLQAVQLAKVAGARVMLAGINGDEKRLQLGKELGADYTINCSEQDIAKQVEQVTDGYGADIVFECSGAVPAITNAIQVVRCQGLIVAVGLTGKETAAISWDGGIFKDCTVKWHYSAQGSTWEKVLRLFSSKKVSAKALITDTAPLSEWKAMFEKGEKREALKVILVPGK